MAQRYKVTKRLEQQGTVQCFEGMDTLNGLPVYVYQFEGRPLKGSDNLSSNSIPDILSVRSDGNRTQVIAAMLPSFQPVKKVDNPEQGEQLLFDTVQALADAAELGLRHGDLHEGRIIGDGHSFKIEGYGVAWSLDGITYVPPEKRVGLAADSYAWAQSMQAILADTLHAMAAGMKTLLQRCLVDNPENRPSAEEILNELHNMSFELTGDSSPSSSSDAISSQGSSASSDFNFDSLAASSDEPAPNAPNAPTATSAPSKGAVEFNFDAFDLGGGTAQNSGTASADNSTSAEAAQPKDAYEALFAEDFGIETPASAPSQPTPEPASEDSPFGSLLLDGANAQASNDDDDGFSIDIDDDIQQPLDNYAPPPAVTAAAPPMPEEARNETAAEKEQRKKMKTTFVKGPPPGATIKAGKDNSRDGTLTGARDAFFEEEDIAKKGRRGGLPFKTMASWLVGLIVAAALLVAAIYFLPQSTPPLVNDTTNYTLKVRLAAGNEAQAAALFVVSAPEGSRKKADEQLSPLSSSYSIISFDAPGIWQIQARSLEPEGAQASSSVLRLEVPEVGFQPNSSFDISLDSP